MLLKKVMVAWRMMIHPSTQLAQAPPDRFMRPLAREVQVSQCYPDPPPVEKTLHHVFMAKLMGRLFARKIVIDYWVL